MTICKICDSPISDADYMAGKMPICFQCHSATYNNNWRHIQYTEEEKQRLSDANKNKKGYYDKLILAYLLKHRNEIVVMQDFTGVSGYGIHRRMLMESNVMVSIAPMSGAFHVLYWMIDSPKESSEADHYFNTLDEVKEYALEHLT